MKDLRRSFVALFLFCFVSIIVFGLIVSTRRRLPWTEQSQQKTGPPIYFPYCANRPNRSACDRKLAPLLLSTTSVTEDVWNATFDGTSGYLLPVLLYGPNNQYHGFKETIVLAHMLNRKPVVSPFFSHYVKKSVEPPNIDANDVLDVDRLATAYGAATMDEFRQACDNRVQVLFVSKNFGGPTANTMLHRLLRFMQVTRLGNRLLRVTKGEQPEFVPDVDLRFRTKKISGVRDALAVFGDKRKCALLLFPFMAIDVGKYLPLLSHNVKRPAPVRTLAKGFLKKYVGEDKSYGCLHWRYNEEWSLTWCENYWPQPHKKSAAEFGLPQFCSILDVSVGQLAVYLNVVAAKYELSHIYLASPFERNSTFVTKLKKEVSVLLTVVELLSFAEASKGVIKRSHHLSLIEQEICSDSTVFIGSRKSTWSWNVLEERNGRSPLHKPRTLWIADIESTINNAPLQNPA